MQYMTIVLELLKEREELYEQLRMMGQLLSRLNSCAEELKAGHEVWMETVALANPGSDPMQISSQAMELAIQDFRDRLPAASPPDEEISLDQVMAFLQGRSSTR